MSECNACGIFCPPVIACNKCKVVWFCKKTLTGFCEKAYNRHIAKCHSNSATRQALRYRVGTEVYSHSSANNITWIICVVVEQWPQNAKYVYLVRNVSDGTVFGVSEDSHRDIRLLDFDPSNVVELLNHTIKYSGTSEAIRRVLDDNKLSWKDYGQHVLLKSAEYGQYILFIQLLLNMNIDPSMTDSKGRNFLHLAAMNNRMHSFMNVDLLKNFREYSSFRVDVVSLLFSEDTDGRNVLHLGIISLKDNILLSWFENICEVLNYFMKHSRIFYACDNMGRTPLDYVQLLKKTVILQPLVSVCVASQIHCFRMLCEICASDNTFDDVAYLSLLKEHLSCPSCHMDDFLLDESIVHAFRDVIEHILHHGLTKSLEFLLQSKWPLEQILDVERDNERILSALLHMCVKSKEMSIFNYSLHAELVSLPESEKICMLKKMMRLFYDLMFYWDPNTVESFSEFLNQFRRQNIESTIITGEVIYDGLYNTGLTLEPMLDRKYDKSKLFGDISCELLDRRLFNQFIMKMHDNLSKSSKLSTFKLVADRLLLHSNGFYYMPPLHLFIVNHQPHLFCWFVEHYQINLHNPLNCDAELMECAMQHFWMFDDNHENFQDNISIGEFLCALCVRYDVLIAYQCLRTRYNDVRIQNRNMIELGLISGSFLTVRWCLCSADFPMAQKIINHKTVVLAVRYGMHHTVVLALTHLGNKKLFMGDIQLMNSFYNMTGSWNVTNQWCVSATKIQQYVRGALARIKHSYVLSASWTAFKRIWGPVILTLKSLFHTNSVELSWSEIKAEYEIIVIRGNDLIAELTNSLNNMTMDENDNEDGGKDDLVSAEQLESTHSTVATDSVKSHILLAKPSIVCDIEISSHVVHWLVDADVQFKQLFLNRIAQLAAGDRSYALSKRLKGCDFPLYETKLDRGVRILWTQVKRNIKYTVLVWFVSKHDKVSRCIEAINRSSQRLAKTPAITTDDGSIGDSLQLLENDVLADPTSNAPLRLHMMSSAEILSPTWKPALLLSDKQQQVNDESGTVLLLGRSGTGKTLCLCDRMTRDRIRGQISQLFVCRSKRLCEFVQSYQRDQSKDCESDLVNVHFKTLSAFTQLMSDLVAAEHGQSPRSFLLSNHVNYTRFVALVFDTTSSSQHKKCSVTPSIVWLHVRSFIKGSVEVVCQQAPLSLEQYLDTNVFGADRCRLTVEDRRDVYAVYLRYQNVLLSHSLWDDADYTLDLLSRSKLEPLAAVYDKVYVDEVQDNTQAEIVLYFLAAGMNTQSLFLAGDPAQSVVEGVDFRFEDVRGIVHKLSNAKHSIHRPMKLFTNYRSHSGILNCASSVLDKMFAMFPGAANVLPKDVGLFKGPKPTCCQVDGLEGLSVLLSRNERLVILCVDEDVVAVGAELIKLGVKNVVIGIRAAKGLEFSDVVLLNFFGHVSKADQVVWKSLFTSESLPASSQYPHIELQLKLFYTAITRNCNRLLFVETEKSQLSSVMLRWFVSAGLAESFSVQGVQVELMTSEEWRAQGIDFAVAAEGENAESLLSKALKCFVQAGESKLVTRIETELSVIQLSKQLAVVKSLSLTQEQEATKIVQQCLNNGLKCTVKEFCITLSDKVENRELFDLHIVSQL